MPRLNPVLSTGFQAGQRQGGRIRIAGRDQDTCAGQYRCLSAPALWVGLGAGDRRHHERPATGVRFEHAGQMPGRIRVRTVPDPILGEVTIPGFPLKYSAFPELLEIQAPLLGQHGADVLREKLNYNEETLTSLKTRGVLYSEDR